MFRLIIYTIFLVLFITKPSLSSDLDILGYRTAIKTDDVDCKFEFIDNWVSDEYHCHIYLSPTDVIEFNSDPHTKMIGRIHRLILIDDSDISKIYEKVVLKYGEPKDRSPNGRRYVWGDASLDGDPTLGIYLIENMKNGGVGLSMDIDKCSSINCGLFENYNETTTVIEFMLLNTDWNDVNGDSIREGNNQTEKVFHRKYGEEYEQILTEDVSKIQF